MNRQFADAECPSCGVVHKCDLDEEGYPDLETDPCQGSDDCTRRLCRACVRHCFNCELPCCSEHCSEVGGKVWCDICLKDAATAEAVDTLADDEILLLLDRMAAEDTIFEDARAS